MKLKSLSQKDRYGNMFSVEFFEPDASIPMMMMIPDMADGYNGADSSSHPGEPKGTDTVPAWLTPGENVVNAEASRLPGNQEKIDAMNEQGREIQAAQGGPIPTYAAGGSQVPRYDGMLNSLGNKLSARDGGPMYSAAGDFVTDDLLDRLRMVESGGDANATSEVGAMGQYQIMPATAQQPGYGVTPLAVEDIRDPKKSREFARQYLMGIAKANPDFTEDEVITAYHSGVGNVRKAKEGTEALGPRGQAYATKIASANSVGPDAFEVNRRKVSSVPPVEATVIGTIGDQTVYSDDMGEFIMSPDGEIYLDGNQLKAVTPVAVDEVPAPEAPVPSPNAIDFSQYSDPVTGPRVPTQIAGSEDQRIRDEAILKTMEVPSLNKAGGDIGDEAYNDLYSVPPSRMSNISPQTTDKFGVPKDKLPKNESLGKQGLRNKVIAAEDEIAKAKADLEAAQAQLEIEISSSGGVTPQTVEKGKRAKEDLANAEKTKAGVEKDIAKLDTAEAKVISDRQKDAEEILDFETSTVPATDDEPPEPADDTKAVTNQKKNAAGMVMQQLGKVNTITVEGEKGINDLINSLPESPENSSKFKQVSDEVGGWFKETFSSMFSGPEIARMLVTYAGSRIMGYDHGASLNYSMKNYVERIDAQEKQYQEDIRDEDYQDFTEASRKEFEKTKDYSVLRKKKAAVTMEKPTGNSYLPGIGKVQRFLGTDGNEYVEYQGGFASVASVADLLEPWDEATQGRKAVADQFKASFDSALETGNRNNNLGAGNKGNNYKDSRVALETVNLAKKAESRYREILRQNGVSINDVPELQISVNNAISKYVNDTIDYKMSGGKGTKPNSIRAYINAETRAVLTGVPQFEMNGASENNMNVLDDRIKKEVRDENGKRIGSKDKGYAEEYENLWLATYEAYKLRSEYPDLDSQSNVDLEDIVNKKREGKKDPKNEWTPFTLWMSRTPASEVQAIIEQAKLDGKLR